MNTSTSIQHSGQETRDAVAERIAARARAQQQARDAAVERQAREAQVRLAAVRQRAEFKRDQRAAAAADKQAARDGKRAARLARRARRTQARVRLVAWVRRAGPVWGLRVLKVVPIAAPMAVAWIGQIGFAREVLGWPLAGGVVFAAAWELSSGFTAWMYHQARTVGDKATLFRASTWLLAGAAGSMNYWHASPSWAPTPAAVSYGVMSLVGIGLWELYASLVHRRVLRAKGLMPAVRPRFGLARWWRFPRITFTAWSLSIRDAIPTAEQAWSDALAERTQARERAEARAQQRRDAKDAAATASSTADAALDQEQFDAALEVVRQARVEGVRPSQRAVQRAAKVGRPRATALIAVAEQHLDVFEPHPVAPNASASAAAG